MSTEQQKQMEWIIRIITIVMLGIATMYGKSVVEKTDKMYDFVIRHDSELKQTQKDLDRLENIVDAIKNRNQTYIRQGDPEDNQN